MGPGQTPSGLPHTLQLLFNIQSFFICNYVSYAGGTTSLNKEKNKQYQQQLHFQVSTSHFNSTTVKSLQF